MPVALITGATAGIGRALAFTLGRRGWSVGACGRTAARVEALLADLAEAGIRAAGRAADVGREPDAAGLVAHVEGALGPVDLLVNNAGVLHAKRLEELSVAEVDETYTTNVRALFLTTRAVLPGMRARGRGDIVNVASLAGRNGFVGGTAYAASKHAVLGFSRSLMLETRKHGIRVLAVCPGSVDTAMLRDQPLLPSRPERILTAEDVAQAIADALALPARALVSELDIRPTDP